jgi:hypothetical protein
MIPSLDAATFGFLFCMLGGMSVLYMLAGLLVKLLSAELPKGSAEKARVE